MLDVRSYAVYGSKCDLLGSDQWRWLEKQFDDQTPVALTIVTSGIQVKVATYSELDFFAENMTF